MKRVLTTMLVILCVLSIVVAAGLAYDYFDEQQRLENERLQQAETQAIVAAEEIGAAFGERMAIAQEIADDLTDGTLAYTDIREYMLDVVRVHRDIDGLAITFEPFVYNPDVRLFQTYVFQTEDGSFDVLEGATYDYTRRGAGNGDAETAWYVNTIDAGAQWHEPFFATGAQKILVEYGVPFYPTDAETDSPAPAGIVSIDYALEDVRELIATLELGETGYGFVMSGEGTFLTHPVPDFAVNRTIYDFLADSPALVRSAEAALTGDSSTVDDRHPLTGEPTWYFFEPIGATGWAIGLVLNQSQFQPDPREEVRNQMTIALAVAGAVFFAATTVFHLDRYNITNFWAVSAVFSVLCVVLIVMVWVLTNRLELRSGVSVTSESQLDRYIEGVELPAGTFTQPEQVPTGLFVQSLDFPNPTAVNINGYIWQRYDVDSTLERGFALPQRTGPEATIEEVQREVIDDSELIVWYIGVTLRQTYDTTRFPFDHRNISIRIVPADLSANVILTPDLGAYDLLDPGLLPAVDPLAQINNWELRRSRFSYNLPRPEAAFRLTEDRFNNLPELYFNIRAERNYLGPFIAYLLPGIIAAAMTFAYLLNRHEPGNKDESTNALNYAAALFFVVAVIHTALRDQIAAVGITYLEHLYILLYVAIIAVAANIFVVARFPDWAIVRYRDNLAPKVLYWPVFAGVMLVSTLLVFVYSG